MAGLNPLIGATFRPTVVAAEPTAIIDPPTDPCAIIVAESGAAVVEA